jgi:1,3-beta-glucanosyltransferase GAS1
LLTRLGLVEVNGDSVSTLEDFNYLSAEIASINPTGPNSADYNPTNTAAAQCPSVGAEWQAASSLPPTPNQQLCECMYNALSCVPNNVDPENYGDLFGTVCGLSEEACRGIQANASSANYGAYGMCNPQQQLGWALNAYYEIQNQAGNTDGCNFSGSATVTQGTAPTGECLSLISQAGSDGQGTVPQPTATGGSGSGGSGSGSSNAGVSGFASHPSTVGMFQAGLYLLVAFVSGMGMILL